MISRAVVLISIPPGDRASSRTSPVTAMDVSTVNCWNRSQTSGVTLFLTMTDCSTPVPSRTTMNATLPDERRCVTQPRTETTRPTYSRSASIRTNDDVIDIAAVTDMVRQAIFGVDWSQRRLCVDIAPGTARLAGRSARVSPRADACALGGRDARRRATPDVAHERWSRRIESPGRLVARHSDHLD